MVVCGLLVPRLVTTTREALRARVFLVGHRGSTSILASLHGWLVDFSKCYWSKWQLFLSDVHDD